MNFEYNKAEALKNGIDIVSLEKLIADALQFLESNNIDWLEGIELINDLIALKWHDDSVLSKGISEQILNWIEGKYDSNKVLDFMSYHVGDNSEEEKSAKRLNLTLDTIYSLHPNVQVLTFIQNKLKESKTDFEKREFKKGEENLRWRIQKINEKVELNNKIKDEILRRTDEYFKIRYAKKPGYGNGYLEDLFCGLRETISEHESSYSISWCLVSEKYLSRSKRAMIGGGGAVFLSKETDFIQMSGSAPRDWVELFELEIHQEEIYWVLEIGFNKRKISKLKRLLEVSTSEILKMVNNDSKIRIEDEEGILEYMKEELDKYEIENTLHKLRRSRNQNG